MSLKKNLKLANLYDYCTLPLPDRLAPFPFLTEEQYKTEKKGEESSWSE